MLLDLSVFSWYGCEYSYSGLPDCRNAGRLAGGLAGGLAGWLAGWFASSLAGRLQGTNLRLGSASCHFGTTLGDLGLSWDRLMLSEGHLCPSSPSKAETRSPGQVLATPFWNPNMVQRPKIPVSIFRSFFHGLGLPLGGVSGSKTKPQIVTTNMKTWSLLDCIVEPTTGATVYCILKYDMNLLRETLEQSLTLE